MQDAIEEWGGEACPICQIWHPEGVYAECGQPVAYNQVTSSDGEERHQHTFQAIKQPFLKTMQNLYLVVDDFYLRVILSDEIQRLR